MDGYFDDIVNRLTMEDMKILGTLFDNDATATFKAMGSQRMAELTNLSESKFRKAVSRLVAIHFVEVDTNSKEHALYVTRYGARAVEISLFGEVNK